MTDIRFGNTLTNEKLACNTTYTCLLMGSLWESITVVIQVHLENFSIAHFDNRKLNTYPITFTNEDKSLASAEGKMFEGLLLK